ncbi:hypothetical protein QZH41_005501 [Actinostola sp. cb2023]|nr:hypothetical protein QZH41_005501 [Actinostola sp. cb2023]
MGKRSQICPGCKKEKANHKFGTLGKFCTGDDGVDDSHSDHESLEHSQQSPTENAGGVSALVTAVRELSLQMETMQADIHCLKDNGQRPTKDERKDEGVLKERHSSNSFGRPRHSYIKQITTPRSRHPREVLQVHQHG